MPVHVENLESEVIAEPEPVTNRKQPRPAWMELDRLRALRTRLLRDLLRTESSGEQP